MAKEHEMIVPFSEKQTKEGVISFGLSSYGYDIRVADEFKVFNAGNSTTIDPKSFDSQSFLDIKGKTCIIPPNSFVLTRTVEYFKIPRNILTICLGKSTYARAGVHINVTPFEPEWEGYATIAINNSTQFPARVYAGEGIGQILFLESDEDCQVSYADKKGKYQAQKRITLPRL